MHYELTTQDPYTLGLVYKDGAFIEEIPFNWIENELEWQEEADYMLAKHGYLRDGPWRQSGCDLIKDTGRFDYRDGGKLVSNDDLEGVFEEQLNDVGDPVDLFGYLYLAGTTLRNVDYTAFREMYLEWLDDQITAGYVQELRRY